MNDFTTKKSIVFILGAGFNRDAAGEAGQIMTLPSGRPAQYPLVSDLLSICFGFDALPPGKSIEDLFQDSMDRGDLNPLKKLCDVVMEADYYIYPHLKHGGNHEDNVYIRFLRDFPNEHLLTFNYDSLLELLLLAERSWCPSDGYGVPVKAHKKTIRKGNLPVEKSLRPILHLHGSLCIYPSNFYLEYDQRLSMDILKSKPPEFIFDPDVLGSCFSPFERITPGVTYTPVSDRVIAPVPNKAKGLKGEFIKAVYRKAEEFLRTSRKLVFIGYSFNLNDIDSYKQLVELASKIGIPVLLIAPDADAVKKRLTDEYPEIQWTAKSISFKEWVNQGYPGV